MGGPTSSYASAGIALRVSEAHKPHHHDKVETPSVGNKSTQKHIKIKRDDQFTFNQYKATVN
jgi:hypothetical protein